MPSVREGLTELESSRFDHGMEGVSVPRIIMPSHEQLDLGTLKGANDMDVDLDSDLGLEI